MLPWAGSPGIAQLHSPTGFQGPDHIRYQPVAGPVSSPHHVSGPCRCYSLPLTGKIGMLIGMNHQFASPFAGTVRIIPSHGVILAVAPYDLSVFITFVGGDHDTGMHRGTRPDDFQ